MNEFVPAQVPEALSPEPIKHAAVLGSVKATPFGWQGAEARLTRFSD